MNCLPTISREMLSGSRRPATYRQRLIAAAAAMGMMLLIFSFHGPFTRNAQLSYHLFVAISILGFAYALLAGVFLTTDCVCSERREGTLPLLFLTKLSGFDVALGKLFSTSLVSSYTLLAILRMLGLPLLMGGVTGSEFARVCLALGVTLLLSLTTGLLCSTLCRDSRSAVGATFAILLFLTGLLYVALWVIEILLGFPWATQLYCFSPMSAFMHSFAPYYRAGSPPYWGAIITLSSLAWIQFGAVCCLIRRLQLPAEASSRTHQVTSRTQSRIQGNPYQWLLLRDRYPSVAGLLVGLLIGGLEGGCLVGSLLVSRNLMVQLFVTAVIAAFALHVLVKGLVITQASRRLAEDRQSGALELLLVTPLSPQEILSVQFKALRRQFGWLIGLLLLMNFALCATVTLGKSQLHMSTTDQAIFCSFFVGGALLLVADYFLIPWVAFAEAVRGRKHHRVVLSTVLRALAPSWLALFCFIFIAMGIGGSKAEAVATFYWLWVIGSGIYVLTIGANRAMELRSRFRALAAGEIGTRTPSNPVAPPILSARTPPPLPSIVKG